LNYCEAKIYLDGISKKGIIFGLDSIKNLMNELGNPQDELKFVHIAGTNGKGSVLTFCSEILEEAGYIVGRYTSPALLSRREQIQVNGEWITKEDFVEIVNEIRNAIGNLETKNLTLPTAFEVDTAVAFLYFKKMKCDIVVLETGMGGRYDATNIVKETLVAAFSSISLDHMEFLGNTIEDIAKVKAGIIKPGAVVVSGIQKPSVLSIIEEEFVKQNKGLDGNAYDSNYRICEGSAIERFCKTSISSGINGCSWLTFVKLEDIIIHKQNYKEQVFTYKNSEPYSISMMGNHQIENAVVAVEIINALDRLGFSISKEAVEKGLEKAQFFGRFTTLRDNPIFIVDGAHNENGIIRLKDNIRTLFPDKKIVLIMGIFKDKEYDKIAKEMVPIANAVYTITLPNLSRSIRADELKAICEKYNQGSKKGKCQGDSNVSCNRDINDGLNRKGPFEGKINITACPSIADAVKMATNAALEDGVVVAFGSLSYLPIVADVVKGM